MKKFNRLLALLLAVLLCLSMFSAVAFAADEEEDDAPTSDATDSSESETGGIKQKVDPSRFNPSSTQTIPASFLKVSENKNLALYLDNITGEYALHDKRNNTTMFSNPLDRKQDNVANSETERLASAHLGVTFITASYKSIDVTSLDAKIITEKYGDSQIISYFFDSDTTFFIIPVMLTLKEEYLEVELLIDCINEMSDSRILSISLMQMFGAGNPKDTGYILLPDGMGSLMKFNEPHSNIDVYNGWIYGEDPTAKAAINEYNYGRDLTEGVRLPIYGIKKNDSAFLAVIDQCEANVMLKAYCAGMLNSYNFIYPTITIRNSQTRRTSTGTTGAGVYYSDELPENFVMRIYPLVGDKANYIGMANKYREYLINDIGMTPIAEDAGTPMNVTMIGAYKRTKHFLGFPYTGVDTMTTFEQSGEILKDMTDKGVDNLICGMLGWNAGGLESAVSTTFNPEKQLGGKKGAAALMDTADSLNIPLMFDVDLVHYYTASGNYKKFNSTVYGLDLAPTAMFPFILSVNRVDKKREPHFLFHPTAMLSIANDFVSDASGVGLTNYSFSSVGSEPYPAFNTEDVSTRDQSTAALTQIFDNVAEQTDGIITTSNGNAYVLPGANNIIDAPLYSSHMYFAEEEVPFYHIALRGLTRISGPAINLSAEKEDLILRSAQFGVGLYAVLSHESSSNLKDTSYNYYYSTEYALLGEEIVDAYKRLDVVYDAIGTSAIVNYQVVSDTLKVTTFANGAKVYVNYSDAEVSYNGIKIAANDFTVVGGDK